jgi:DNA-binding transcriptional MerR regulator
MMTIGELARRAGVAASAVRYYEAVGLLQPGLRRSGRRVYDEEALRRLAVITFAKTMGFSLREIGDLIQGFGKSRWNDLAKKKLSDLQTLSQRIDVMRKLLAQALRCGCLDVDACGRTLMNAKGSGRKPADGAGAARR